MVDGSPSSILSVAPTSVIDLYAQCRAGALSPSPSVISLELPVTGVTYSSLGSLTWIDTAFAQTLATRRFLEAIQAGAIPSPLDGRCEHPVNGNIWYQSPERLLDRPITLLEALGLTTSLATLATRSLTLECPHCGSISTRYPSAQHAIAAIQSSTARPIVLFAEGERESVEVWARSHGLSSEIKPIDHTSSRARLAIDSTSSTQQIGARLSELAHSLWRLRAPALVCSQDSTTQVFSKHGSCASCGHLFQAVRYSDISLAIRTNVVTTDARDNLASRVLPHSKSVRTLFLDSLDTLRTIPALSNSRALELALRTSLRAKAAGTLTNKLSTSELAALVLCRSLGDALDATGTCVLDIPEPALRDTSKQSLSTILSQATTHAGVVILSSAEAAPSMSVLAPRDVESGELIGTLRVESATGPARTYPLKQGQDTRLTESSFEDVEACLLAQSPEVASVSFSPNAMFELTSISTFRSERRSTTLLLHRLGLADKLANLFASSIDARTAGLGAKDFAFSTSGRAKKNLCGRCDGMGVILTDVDELPRPVARECALCHGGRFTQTRAAMRWRGTRLSDLLNSPLRAVVPLIRALPRATEIVECVEALGLTHLPLGMPIALLSRSELHALLWAQALLRATRTKPAIVLTEDTLGSLTSEQRTGLRSLLQSSPRAAHLSVIELPVG